MTAAIAMNLPGSRVVVGWWRDLAARHPRRLWFAHFPIHHIEALIERNTPSPHEVLGQALLTLLRDRCAPIDLPEIQTWLSLDAGLVDILIDKLQSQGVLRRTDSQTIALCPSACVEDAVPPRPRERKVFHFTDGEPPLFLPLTESACAALMPPATWSFDLTCLQHCLSQPVSWRSDNRFDEDVSRLLLPDDLPPLSRAEAVALDRAEQTLLVLVQTDDGLLGFAVSPEGWEIHREPALSLPMNADLSLTLTAPLTAEQWRQAWRAWCQQRSLPAAEVEACKLEPVDHRLIVHAPGRLTDRLRQSRSDTTRGDGWLLAGSGRVRHAALVELAS